MYKIKRDSRNPYMFEIKCYYYIHEVNLHSFLYSIRNITIEGVAQYLKDILDEDTIEDIKSVVLLTNNPAYVSDLGVVSAVA